MGQPELQRRLRHPAYAAFNQRITMRFHLRPLDEQDALEYLRFRWIVAGGLEETFPFLSASVNKIFAYSSGVPRLINSLATTCLIDAMGKGLRKIEPEMVDQQAQDVGLFPHPITKAGNHHGRHGRSA
jgi:general secretion pathway protein A